MAITDTVDKIANLSFTKIIKILFVGSIFVIYTLLVHIDNQNKLAIQDREKASAEKQQILIEKAVFIKLQLEDNQKTLKQTYLNEKTIDSLKLVLFYTRK